jgi:hypothetical protein
LKNNTCVFNALDPKKERVLEEIFEALKGFCRGFLSNYLHLRKFNFYLGAGSTSYTHYLSECNYTISDKEKFKLEILKVFLANIFSVNFYCFICEGL